MISGTARDDRRFFRLADFFHHAEGVGAFPDVDDPRPVERAGRRKPRVNSYVWERGRIGQERPVGTDVDQGGCRVNTLADEILVGQHHRLGMSRSPRCVDDRGDVVFEHVVAFSGRSCRGSSRMKSIAFLMKLEKGSTVRNSLSRLEIIEGDHRLQLVAPDAQRLFPSASGW